MGLVPCYYQFWPNLRKGFCDSTGINSAIGHKPSERKGNLRELSSSGFPFPKKGLGSENENIQIKCGKEIPLRKVWKKWLSPLARPRTRLPYKIRSDEVPFDRLKTYIALTG